MTSPIILWFRRDLRLADHPALTEAVASGRPVIPVFLHDDLLAGQGAAPRFRIGLSLAALAADLENAGSRLILRRGAALPQIRKLIDDTGAGAVYWSRAYVPDADRRDREIAAALGAAGIETRDFPGHLLFDPDSVETKTGGPYKVFTPYWKAVRGRDPGAPLPAPGAIPAPGAWPESDRLESWNLAQGMARGAAVVARHVTVGAEAAARRLDAFLDQRVDDYATARDFADRNGTSGLSENLTYGEISPRACWAAAQHPRDAGSTGAETFLKELAWREFAYHLLHHTPRLATGNWREEWDAFPWRDDPEAPDVLAWQQGRTGIPMVDAAMRELYVTGRMHNRARMIAGSYLTKHMMCHWKIGRDWFADCLIDWDPASNAMGWQWVAGSGPDASPFFRVFNPEGQRAKFDPSGGYVRAWLAEGQLAPPDTALSFFEAVPESWGLAPNDLYPDPIVPLDVGRERALEAYRNRDF